MFVRQCISERVVGFGFMRIPFLFFSPEFSSGVPFERQFGFRGSIAAVQFLSRQTPPRVGRHACIRVKQKTKRPIKSIPGNKIIINLTAK